MKQLPSALTPFIPLKLPNFTFYSLSHTDLLSLTQMKESPSFSERFCLRCIARRLQLVGLDLLSSLFILCSGYRAATDKAPADFGLRHAAYLIVRFLNGAFVDRGRPCHQA